MCKWCIDVDQALEFAQYTIILYRSHIKLPRVHCYMQRSNLTSLICYFFNMFIPMIITVCVLLLIVLLSEYIIFDLCFESKLMIVYSNCWGKNIKLQGTDFEERTILLIVSTAKAWLFVEDYVVICHAPVVVYCHWLYEPDCTCCLYAVFGCSLLKPIYALLMMIVDDDGESLKQLACLDEDKNVCLYFGE